MKSKTAATKYSIELAIGPSVERLPIIIRKHPRSRRMVIRYQPRQHHVTLTLPRYVSIRQGLHFVEEKRAWLERHIRGHARQIPFFDGTILPVFGKNYTLTHVGGRGVITIDENKILVPGQIEFMERRMREWVIALAKESIAPLARAYAAQIGKKIKRISVRDTTSRWGSCSYNGSLSFSWRLLFAPYEILDYVICHEVAHLKEHNHSAAYWKVVEGLCPEYEKYEKWLKTNGAKLYTYGG